MSALLRLRHGLNKLHGGGSPSRLLPKATMASYLKKYGHDLTAVAANSDPVVGRDDEINRVLCVLSRKSKNSAVLVGAAGVGKTAIARAWRVASPAARCPARSPARAWWS
ncbi:hypothetical protein EJB05_06172, partial [Eragrostis curvula]